MLRQLSTSDWKTNFSHGDNAMDMNVLSLTQRLLAFDTTNPGGSELECSRFLGNLLDKHGFTVSYHEFAKNRVNVIAALAGAQDDPPLCMSSHMDTIPTGLGPWKHNPFGGVIEDGKLYGRGTSDTKSSLAAMVLAAVRVAAIPNRKRGLLLILTGAEETGNSGAEALARRKEGLPPSGSLIIGEPTSNYPMVGHKGALWLEARAIGVSAHGSMPELGENAIYKAAEAIIKLRDFDFDIKPHPLLGSPTLNIGAVTGGLNINSIPDRAEFKVDIRSILGQNHDDLIKDLDNAVGELVHFTVLLDRLPVYSDYGDVWIQDVFDAAEAVTHARPTPKCLKYFTDASAMRQALGEPPTIILGPGEADMAHKTDEYCFVSKLTEAENLYFEISRAWCSS